MALEGKVIAITGGGSGIGRATAQLLATRGATIALADKNEKGLTETIQSLGAGKHTADVVDVTISEEVDSWIEKTAREHGKLDGAANIAGISNPARPMKEETDANLESIMRVNAFGTYYCLRAELNNIVQSGGSIVNVSSVAGLIGVPGASIYSASKHAVVGMTRSAAKENPDVRINAVAPGGVDTPLLQAIAPEMALTLSPQLIKRPGQASEIAKLIVFLLSDDSSFTTGSVYSADGGWAA